MLSAVDVEFGAGDVARLIRTQIIDRLGDFLGVAVAAQAYPQAPHAATSLTSMRRPTALA